MAVEPMERVKARLTELSERLTGNTTVSKPGAQIGLSMGAKCRRARYQSREWKSARLDRDVRPLACAGIELARPADALYRVLDHLLPLRDPAGSAGDSKQRGEHLGREAERLERDPRIEVDIRIKLLLDEIVVVQRDPLKLKSDLKNGIVAMADRIEDLVTGLLHDLAPEGHSS